MLQDSRRVERLGERQRSARILDGADLLSKCVERQAVRLGQRLQDVDHLVLQFRDGRIGVDAVIDDRLQQFGQGIDFDATLSSESNHHTRAAEGRPLTLTRSTARVVVTEAFPTSLILAINPVNLSNARSPFFPSLAASFSVSLTSLSSFP